jgi:hypothetical protein
VDEHKCIVNHILDIYKNKKTSGFSEEEIILFLELYLMVTTADDLTESYSAVLNTIKDSLYHNPSKTCVFELLKMHCLILRRIPQSFLIKYKKDSLDVFQKVSCFVNESFLKIVFCTLGNY